MADITSVKLPDNSEYNLKDVVSGRGSNENILINGWFTVNQRGAASYSATEKYTVDRWKMIVINVSVGVTSNGVTLSHSNSTERRTIAQHIERTEIEGKTVRLLSDIPIMILQIAV